MKRLLLVVLMSFFASPSYAEIDMFNLNDDTGIHGNWLIQKDVSAFEDTQDIYITNEASRIKGRYDYINPRLTIRCHENVTSVIFDSREYLGLDELSVRFRHDDDAPYSRSLSISTNNQAFGFWKGSKAIPVVKRLLGNDRLYVKYTPYGESARIVAFEVAGLSDLIGPLRESCSW